MIKLIELLQIKGIPFENYKIHLATPPSRESKSPLEVFFGGNFKIWQEKQTRKNFECDHIVSLISLPKENEWLFAGVYKVLGVGPGEKSTYLYQTQVLSNQDDVIGRVIVQFKRPGRASYLRDEKYGNELTIQEILPTRMSIGEFPGYDNVVVSHGKLAVIVNQQEPSWKSALSTVKGVYLIADTGSGKLYVGSAKGASGLWQRWQGYVQTGHGGNVKLRELITKKGNEYVNNFQYTVLEIADTHATDDYIVERESHWKKVLMSGKFGYNEN